MSDVEFKAHMHHVHLFTEDCEKTIEWWTEILGAEVHFDSDFGGARNVFMKLGTGRIHLYDQRPKQLEAAALHHLGIRVHGLEALYQRLLDKNIALRSGIREFGNWRYIMCPAPDNILLELFEIDTDDMPPESADYFRDDTNT